jgi:hypothetical protein
LDPQNKVTGLVDFKFTFLRIINDHEHYVPLNLVIANESVPSPAELKHEFWYCLVLSVTDCVRQRHFLAGMLLHEIERSLAFSEEQEINAKVLFQSAKLTKSSQ